MGRQVLPPTTSGKTQHAQWQNKNDQDIGLTADDGLRFYWHFLFVFIESGPCVGSTAKLIENVSLTLRGRIIC